jgi:hypothetical protein
MLLIILFQSFMLAILSKKNPTDSLTQVIAQRKIGWLM